MIKVLSIDGGGIRGLIPALFLSDIEQRTSKPIAELFDVVAGTSTGGILALGLTKPGPDRKPQYAAKELVGLYETKGKEIFSRSIWHWIRALDNLIDEKYPAKGIDTVLEEYFGNARLKEVLTDVFITSYALERRMPFFFRSSRAKKQEDYDFSIKKVARATSAAPTYFEPLKLPERADPKDYYALVDGGVFANNPTLCAFVEAKVESEKNDEDYLVVSLGTGTYTRPILYKQAKNWGLVQWAKPILDVVFDGVSDTVDYQMRHLLPERNGVRWYYRFQVTLPKENDAMDDVNPTNLRELRLLAEEGIRKDSEALTALCRQLVG
jgi:patatin-like phospholipase/acyl hydrolase